MAGRSGKAALVVAHWLRSINEASNPVDYDPNDKTHGVFWPVYVGQFQELPHEAICIYDTGGIVDGRLHNGDSSIVHEDVQIRVRSRFYPEAQRKIHNILDYLDVVQNVKVVVHTEESSQQPEEFIIHAMTLLSGAFFVGPDEKNRRHFTANVRTTIRPTE